jgi:hypothetical protein
VSGSENAPVFILPDKNPGANVEVVVGGNADGEPRDPLVGGKARLFIERGPGHSAIINSAQAFLGNEAATWAHSELRRRRVKRIVRPAYLKG